MTTDGVLTHEYDIPTPNSRSLQIAAGHDWALWFTETRATNKIGRLQPFAQHDNGNNPADSPCRRGRCR